tara:strand:- start:647 stop:1030 length:384 start_codon:yes stop_codon:yes gene_type:complete
MSKDLKESGSEGSRSRMREMVRKRRTVTKEKDGDYTSRTVEYKKGKKAGASKTKAKVKNHRGGGTLKKKTVSRGGEGYRTERNTKHNKKYTYVTKGKHGEKPEHERVDTKKGKRQAKKSQRKLLKGK